MSALYTPRERTARILARFAGKNPRMSVERARYFTQYFRSHDHMPMTLRWAGAMCHVMANIEVDIQPDELIVGRVGPRGRYGLFYPELEGAYFATVEKNRMQSADLPHEISEEDRRVIMEELLPYWYGRTFRESLANAVPNDVRELLYRDGDMYVPSFIIHETATVRHSLQWVMDFEKVLQRGFRGIYDEAARRLDSLDINDPENNWDKAPFYKAVMKLCLGIRDFAGRYADLAQKMAEKCQEEERKKELLTIASNCARVPWLPARTFHEALQSLWFVQLVSHIEELHGGIMSIGRMDQYLLPFYEQDCARGLVDEERALELLDCLWLNMAQYVRVQPTAAGIQIYEGHAHWEHTTIGGQLEDGSDATNAMSWLLLRSRREFPLDYPDLSLRVHKGTPQDFLLAVCEAIREGRGPKLMNDEEIIDLFLRKGANLTEARDYAGSGSSEVRLPNRTTYLTGTTWFNLAAVLEMTLYNGHCSMEGKRPLGLATGDPASFATYEELEQAFFAQLANILKHVLIQQYIADTLRPSHIAAPLVSCLHDLCMDEGRDICEGRIKNALILGGQIGPTGFATVVDSLAAIRLLVYERKILAMPRLISALKSNFEGHALERQYCLTAPKFGNGDPHVDDIAKRLEAFMVDFCARHVNYYGGLPEIFFVPVTTHRAMGSVTGATPDGRRAGDALSSGISPGSGNARKGPTAILQSVAFCKAEHGLARAARMLEITLPPLATAGEDGLVNMAAFIRTWSRQKHWQLVIHMDNRLNILAARNDRRKYYAQVMPFAGFTPLPTPWRKQTQDLLLESPNTGDRLEERPSPVEAPQPVSKATQKKALSASGMDQEAGEGSTNRQALEDSAGKASPVTEAAAKKAGATDTDGKSSVAPVQHARRSRLPRGRGTRAGTRPRRV